MNIAIIPARAGSKRIKYKNIVNIGGKPLISWTIKNAILSNVFDRIFVSTDSKLIASIALQEGAEVPFLRDSRLADDITGTKKVIEEMINKLSLSQNDNVCCLYPTAVLLRPEILHNSFNLFNENNEHQVLSISAFHHPIERALKLNSDGLVDFKYPGYITSRTQDFEKKYFDAGQFYWAQAKNWLKEDNSIIRRGFVLNKNDFIDIDDQEDLDLARLLMNLMYKPN
jgi:pseudaminic acid cytidylyltransferase